MILTIFCSRPNYFGQTRKNRWKASKKFQIDLFGDLWTNFRPHVMTIKPIFLKIDLGHNFSKTSHPSPSTVSVTRNEILHHSNTIDTPTPWKEEEKTIKNTTFHANVPLHTLLSCILTILRTKKGNLVKNWREK